MKIHLENILHFISFVSSFQIHFLKVTRLFMYGSIRPIMLFLEHFISITVEMLDVKITFDKNVIQHVNRTLKCDLSKTCNLFSIPSIQNLIQTNYPKVSRSELICFDCMFIISCLLPFRNFIIPCSVQTILVHAHPSPFSNIPF